MLFPVGIPLAFLLTLRRAGVPKLAAWKRDCAWLRVIVQRARLLGFKASLAHPEDDPDTLTVESISLEHLNLNRFTSRRCTSCLWLRPPPSRSAGRCSCRLPPMPPQLRTCPTRPRLLRLRLRLCMQRGRGACFRACCAACRALGARSWRRPPRAL
jgi:hypothetical protein